MATAGFNVSDEMKNKIDEAAGRFVDENGGSKADFLAAMLSAWETAAAKTALAGRANEIEHVEKLLEGIRTAYMASLSMALAARDEARTSMATEMERANATVAELREEINNLKAQLKNANATAATTAAELEQLRATISDVEARAENAEAARAAAEAERAELSAIFQRQIREAEDKSEALAAEVEAARAVKSERDKLAGELATARAEAQATAKKINELEAVINKLETDAQATAKKHQTEIDELNGRFAERMEIAIARAANEKSQAVLDARTEAARELDETRRELAEFIAGMKPKTTNRKGNKKNERNATMESTTAE